MTIANVALPHMQSTMSASTDQITWVLTSYLIAGAIATPLSGWLAQRYGLETGSGAAMAADDGIVLRIPLMDAEPPGAELFEFTAEELEEESRLRQRHEIIREFVESRGKKPAKGRRR